ncbi:MAG: pyruvate synthase, partial [Chloroflexi bacterium RBG_16_57_9]
MPELVEIRWHARAGQGAVTAAKTLADTALSNGKYVQAFPDYGPERMGAPLKAYNRIGDQPIRKRGTVENPSIVVVLDPSLVGTVDLIDGAPEDALYIVNSAESTETVRQKAKLGRRRLYCVDANQIAHECIGLRKPNTPMLGAICRVTGVVGLEELL